jgi:FkbM family methyltransferase
MINLKSPFGWLLSKALYEWNPFKSRRKHAFYAKFIQQGDLAFDVGAHLGDRTDTWLCLGARVVAFEPQPKFTEYLEQKFSHHDDFVLENKGLGAQEGRATLAISSLFPTLSTLAGKAWETEINSASSLNIDFDRSVDIEVSTLALMIEKHGEPKFCKIDVEGFEHEVLQGLKQSITFLSFEFLSFSEDRMQSCMKLLGELGYVKFNWSYKETFELGFEDWVDAESVMQHIKHYKKGIFSGDIYAYFDK